MTTGAFFDGIPESIITGITLEDSDLSVATKAGTCNFTQGVCRGVVLPACPPCLSSA